MDKDFRRDVCGPRLTTQAAESYRAFGFVVLRRFFDPRPLSEETDSALSDGLPRRRRRSGDIRFQYVPMMTSETPSSLSLLDRLGTVAETLMGGPVVPTRAKGTRYYGETPWHVDSTLPIASIGCLAYLERAAAGNGALRVVPGSQHRQFNDALLAIRAARQRDRSLPACVVATDPGDVILMDEHLLHASFGGSLRRQWRVDYLRAPVCNETFDATKAYFAGLYVPDSDEAYDVDRFPSYGRDFRESGRAAVAPLEALGAFNAAAAQEAFIRSRRRAAKSRD